MSSSSEAACVSFANVTKNLAGGTANDLERIILINVKKRAILALKKTKRKAGERYEEEL